MAQFELPYLPYSTSDLEPYISEATMEVHYNKHHRGYVAKLIQALEDSKYEDWPLVELLARASLLGDKIRNNAGGHFNHTLFWSILSPEPIKPYGKLLNQIEAAFESYESFQEQFARKAMSHFGSGWAWLIIDSDGILQLTTTANQDNPLMDVAEQKGYPLFGLDLWEHAYYLDYQNNKADYIDAFWNVLDWTEVSKRHQDALLNIASKIT
ncbi:MAG: superoxide dismutase [Cyclobacteriaceae bacterium]|nr:superoxide dismutase [Cyclobacteriaceae bacterium]